MLLVMGIVLVAAVVVIGIATRGDGSAIGDWRRRRGAPRGMTR